MALVALYRPGAMDQIPTYARQAQPGSIAYIDDRLRSITEADQGVILYQEQSMQIAKSLAGFSGPRADDLRKAIGKKNRDAMAKLRPEFIEGCRAASAPRRTSSRGCGRRTRSRPTTRSTVLTPPATR